MTDNSKVHLNIQSRQFNTLKSLLILAKIRNFVSGAVVLGSFVSWGFCLLGVLSLKFLSTGLLSMGLLYMGLPSAPQNMHTFLNCNLSSFQSDLLNVAIRNAIHVDEFC